jgi:Ni,Fe-hydrogenase III small subunit/NAD-dependent dihydropyrimidine dehydrogenase PreA subunit
MGSLERRVMANPFIKILKTGIVTQFVEFPDLPSSAIGLPKLTDQPCGGEECRRCSTSCPTQAIAITEDADGGKVTLDRGRCIGCGECMEECPTGVIVSDRSVRTATRAREGLILTNRTESTPLDGRRTPQDFPGFTKSLHIREVSTGCNATDQEVAATTNPVFDVARYGVGFVASPRFADALLVTGPVARAMKEPLLRCYEAMAEPRLVIAAGTCAISGGLFREGYHEANGTEGLLPVAAYIPGCPPHPWSIIHGILLSMGRVDI